MNSYFHFLSSVVSPVLLVCIDAYHTHCKHIFVVVVDRDREITFQALLQATNPCAIRAPCESRENNYDDGLNDSMYIIETVQMKGNNQCTNFSYILLASPTLTVLRYQGCSIIL